MARQVFSSVSTTIFSTFSCDYVEDLEVNLLRADYSISCDDKEHLLYQVWLIFKPTPAHTPHPLGCQWPCAPLSFVTPPLDPADGIICLAEKQKQSA